jgi:hypothetical protein
MAPPFLRIYIKLFIFAKTKKKEENTKRTTIVGGQSCNRTHHLNGVKQAR